MRSKLFFCLLSLLPVSSFASPLDHLFSVKDRLRIHLWNEGLAPVKKHHLKASEAPLPVEIEKALQKL